MNFYLKTALFLFALPVLGLNTFFSHQSIPPKNIEPAEEIDAYFDRENQAFLEHAESLDQLVKNLELGSEASLTDLRGQLLATRNQYKKIEFLIAYLDGDFVKDWINGAPLLHLERNSPSQVSILEPEGLQILDELIFGEDKEVFKNKTEIGKKSHELIVRINQFLAFSKHMPKLEDFMIMEACREGLVRSFTLELTGFDTPMSGNALTEASITMESIWGAVQMYQARIRTTHPDLSLSLEQTFRSAIEYIRKNQDFDSFDRLHFLKTYTDPLYKQCLELHHALSLPNRSDLQRLPQSVNYQSTSLFSNHFLNTAYYTSFETDIKSPKRVALGRTLFFDPILSKNNNASCASCHQPGKAFSDGLEKSLAFDGSGYLDRNAPTLINSVFAERFFHDMRQESLEAQIGHVLAEPKEFHSSYLDLIEKIRMSQEYVDMFSEAYPNFQGPKISQHTISTAMSSYVASLQGFNSPFDQYVRGEKETVPENVKAGFNLFMGKAACGTCHFAPVFNGTVPPRYQESESEVLGVPIKHDLENLELDPDIGRYANGRLVERVYFYKHSFKTPTVRNIALTAPYMHNGAYPNLEEVLDFYNRGGGAGMGIEVADQTLPPDELGLDEVETNQIIQFMEALTDTTGMNAVPRSLPKFEDRPEWNTRPIGGRY